MKESQFLGTLLPSHPDFLPIENAIREKYGLPEISPDDDPITEVFLGDEIISLEDFRKDIESQVRNNLTFLPPELLKVYLPAKSFSLTQTQTQLEKLPLIPDDLRSGLEASIKFVQQIVNLIIQIVDPFIDSIIDMLYWYLLTGEDQEIPNDWISKVATIPSMGETMVLAMAGPMSDPNAIAYQFREEYKKTFGSYRPRVTNIIVNTSHYLQLKKSGKSWDYIVEEFIRLNKYSLPRDRSSLRYQQTWKLYEQRLKKRMQRTEIVFEVLIRDKK